jgi:DNA-binding phage protein
MSKTQQPTIVVQIRKPWHHVLREEHISSRSRLYGLVPYEIRTIWRESLTGYINRLGWAHHVSPRAFAAQEIIPRLDEHLRLSIPHVTMFSTQRAMNLNGAGDMVRSWVAILEQLTARMDLHLLTLPGWIGDLSPRRVLRETPVWCPSCLSEWQVEEHPLYQPFFWMLQMVTLCPRHRTPLVNRCPHCQKRQMILATNEFQPGECTHCASWLGAETDSSSHLVDDEELVAWQEWVLLALKELHAASLVTGVLQWKSFFWHISRCLKEQKGYSKLAQLTGIDRTNLYRWVDGEDTYTPTLESIFKFCYVCDVTPLQVMNGQLERLQQIVQEGTNLSSPLPRRQNRRVDRERCQAFLQAILDGREEPFGVYQAARRLGYESCQLVYHFPQECAAITQQAKDYRKHRKEQRLAQVREQVRQAIISVHSQGAYPSQRRLRSYLPSGLMRMPEAKEAWRATLRALGLEH